VSIPRNIRYVQNAFLMSCRWERVHCADTCVSNISSGVMFTCTEESTSLSDPTYSSFNLLFRNKNLSFSTGLYINPHLSRDSRLSTVMRHTEVLFERTNRDSRLNTVIPDTKILFDRTNRDSRLNTIIRHTEILFDRTNRDSRLNCS